MENKENNLKNDKYWWKPVMVFYAKTTGWIILPLVLATFLGKYVGKSFGSQSLFFVFVIVGFLISCYGIYREIKIYKKDLEKNGK
ncbi:MAG: hypothetical protein WC662_04240 [Candidatus Paceibacterota bacterium]|jgi:uncharacterized membrane protein YfcA